MEARGGHFSVSDTAEYASYLMTETASELQHINGENRA